MAHEIRCFLVPLLKDMTLGHIPLEISPKIMRVFRSRLNIEPHPNITMLNQFSLGEMLNSNKMTHVQSFQKLSQLNKRRIEYKCQISSILSTLLYPNN